MGARTVELAGEPTDFACEFASCRIRGGGALADVLRSLVHHHVDLVGIGRRDQAIANRDRLALDLVTLQQPLAAPTPQHGIELPGEIAGIANARVHANATGRRKQVRSVAREEHPPDAPLTRHRLVMVPMHRLQQLELEGLAHRPVQDRGRIELLGAARRIEKIILVVPQLHPVDGREDTKAAGIEHEVQVRQTQAVRRQELAAAKIKADVRAHPSSTVATNAEIAPQLPTAALAHGEVLRTNFAHLARRHLDEPSEHVVGMLRKALATPAVTHFEPLQPLRVTTQHGLQSLLTDLGLRVRRPLQFAKALQRGRVTPPTFIDRWRAEAVQFLTRQPGGKNDVIRMLVGDGGRKDLLVETPAAEQLHGSRPEQRRLRVFARTRALLDEQHPLTAPRQIDGERQAHRPAAHDQHRNIRFHQPIMALVDARWARVNASAP